MLMFNNQHYVCNRYVSWNCNNVSNIAEISYNKTNSKIIILILIL